MPKTKYAHVFNQEDYLPGNLGSQILHEEFAALDFLAQYVDQPFIVIKRFLGIFHAEFLTTGRKLSMQKGVSDDANTVRSELGHAADM